MLPVKVLIEADYYESLPDHDKAASAYRAMFVLFPDNVEYGLQLGGTQNAGGHGSQAMETLAQLRNLPAPASDDPRIDLLEASATTASIPARIVLVQSAERKAAAQGKKLVYAQARKEECMQMNYSDHPDQALPACEDAYNLFLAAGNRLAAADTVRLMGDCEGSLGHLEQSIATYQRALKILAELGEHEKTGAVLNNMAINFANQGQLNRAEQFYCEARSHFEQAGDRGNTATAIGNIADILYLRGDLAGAAKLYGQALELETSLDHNNPGYLLYRLSDLELAQGRVQDAHHLAQRAIDAIRPAQGGYGYLTEAMIQMGEVLAAEGDLEGARQQFQTGRDMEQKAGDMGLVEESQTELADLALEEGRAVEAESLLRPAIAEFEKEKSDPGASAGYTELSRALLLQGKTDEARKAVRRAIELGRTSSDPALQLPAAIQKTRIEIAVAGAGAAASAVLATARQELRAVLTTAKKLGYYNLECEARLALGELEMKANPTSGRSLLKELADDSRSRGLLLMAKKATDLGGTTVVAAVTAR
ncbi:MAG: tetratricopeptide repeat protein [Candidatus Sulfotelmatobacter sp.]